jgi:phenylacetate-CoA ligase
MGAVACQCEKKTGLHVTSHSHLVEVVSDGGQPVLEKEGNIVITSLTNYAMPFLRYWIGDRGRMSANTCPCGRGTPLLESVSGRGMESFVKANGEIVSPIYLITSIGVGIEGGFVKKFQLVQEHYNLVTLKVVANPEIGRRAVEENLARVAEKIRTLLGEDCAVSVQFVDDIPRSPSGKYLCTVCRIWDGEVGVPGERRVAVYNGSRGSDLG